MHFGGDIYVRKAQGRVASAWWINEADPLPNGYKLPLEQPRSFLEGLSQAGRTGVLRLILMAGRIFGTLGFKRPCW